MADIVIAAAARTPVGSFNGAFASLAAHELGAVAITEAMKRANVAPAEVDEKARLRLDDWELRDDVQDACKAMWPQVTTENLFDITDYAGYKHEFLKLFGFERGEDVVINGVAGERGPVLAELGNDGLEDGLKAPVLLRQ